VRSSLADLGMKLHTTNSTGKVNCTSLNAVQGLSKCPVCCLRSAANSALFQPRESITRNYCREYTAATQC
jgi:hypothetical protein